MSPRRSSLIAALTGFHFAGLQVGSFLALESVSSSAWTTYAALTASWLVGSLVGLWLELPPRRTLAIGVVAFEALVLITRLGPWSRGLLVMGIIAAGLGGLWAGGFFVRAARVRAAAAVFLHENNGFAAGLVAATALFAVGGRGALAVLPLVTCASLFRLDEHSKESRMQTS